MFMCEVSKCKRKLYYLIFLGYLQVLSISHFIFRNTGCREMGQDLSLLNFDTLQTHHVYFTLKRLGNGRFHVVLTWNTRGLLVR